MYRLGHEVGGAFDGANTVGRVITAGDSGKRTQSRDDRYADHAPGCGSVLRFSRQAARHAITGMAPVKRRGTPEEMAKAMLYMASDQSSYVLGAELVVDGIQPDPRRGLGSEPCNPMEQS